MIMINLLPHREERRKRKKIAFYAGLGVAAVVGLAIVGVWYLVVAAADRRASSSATRSCQTEIAKLDIQIKDIASLKSEIASLKARQKAVEDLQIDRNVPVHVLNELVRQVPEGIYITSLKQDGQTLSVAGIAQTQERVSELLRNTAYNSEWLVQAGAGREQGDDRAGREQGAKASVRLRHPPDHQAPAGRAGRGVAGGRHRDPRRRQRARVGGRAQEDLIAMATKSKTANVDLNSVFEGAASQFRGLNPNEPGQWPLLPKTLTFVAVALAMVVVGWFVVLSTAHDELDARAQQGADAQDRLPQQAGPGRQSRRAAQAEAAGRGVRHPAREAAARQGRNGRAAVRHQPGRPRPRSAVRALQARARS